MNAFGPGERPPFMPQLDLPPSPAPMAPDAPFAPPGYAPETTDPTPTTPASADFVRVAPPGASESVAPALKADGGPGDAPIPREPADAPIQREEPRAPTERLTDRSIGEPDVVPQPERPSPAAASPAGQGEVAAPLPRAPGTMPATPEGAAAAGEEREIGYGDRVPVPPEAKSWDVDVPGYEPPAFTTEWVRTTGVELGVSDPESPTEVDFSKRPSFVEGGYTVDERGYPRNPMGRQGLADRGDLSKWGPNQAADPIVVASDPEAGDPKLLMVRRRDTGQWALPGGMVDPGEHVSKTATRELGEEAGIDLRDMEGEVVYEGYVDDPRNTDNAWLETTARLFRVDHTPQARAGDDAADARWFGCSNTAQLTAETQQLDTSLGLPAQPLYASHAQIIDEALQRL